MTARPRLLALALASTVLATTLALASLAGAERPPLPGGSVPSTLELSLGEPSLFTRSGPGELFTATIRAEVSATDTPVSLSLGEEEALERWSEPVAGAVARLHLRREAPNARTLRNRLETVVVTLMAGGP